MEKTNEIERCECDCHDTGEEHSMCSDPAESCTYSRGGPAEEEDANDFVNDPIFDLLNCYEVEASEVHHGMTYIDSAEAEKLTKKIRQILEREKVGGK
jgi:hypothetical protein